MTMTTERNYAVEALYEFAKALDGNISALGDFVYDIREREGAGWEGPRVLAWTRGVYLAEQALTGSHH